MFLATAVALFLATGPVQDDPDVNAIARVIDVALDETQYDSDMVWSAFGGKTRQDVSWNLSGPDADQSTALPPGVYRRTGWIVGNRVNVSVAACGDRKTVRTLTLSASQFRREAANVSADLTALGVRLTELERTEAVLADDAHVDDYYRSLATSAPARVIWSLQKPGREDATLSAEHRCTPPGTRSATRCWTRFTVRFQPRTEPPTDCPLPGRYEE